ncbi:MAG: 30S ribosomal protein S5, small subunit ribosomal protein S5 [Candidatus Peregrinibacteria bacterium GW2011_GWE2_39_6]|nr:MAG: 30S ribosomal protein S5, small subunit ribosomal protein S5 [Candidatus Peregrinibacteria bacterium GW2011_GWF2_39_17]KKR26550.1 MAG: 30S ribosomal protein S5, small subunit ribosomal protein S5 [Candidatus Peregrinibacteria bacterium GW2011_GWE2_39_6]
MAPPKNQKRPHKNQEPKEFDEEVIQLDRVTRVVKGGRRLRFRATVAIGNRKGRIGLGIGKSAEVVGAIKKAVTMAKKHIIQVPIYRTTIPHRIQCKFKASKILLIPAGPGTGIIAGGATRKIIELSGIKNILSKTIGASNRVNNAKATFKALQSLRTRIDHEKEISAPTPKDKDEVAKKSTPVS